MIEIRARDRVPMERFGLAWRFTDERWTSLPSDDLAEICPLRIDKAAELNERSLHFFSEPYELASGQFACLPRVSAPAEKDERTRRWLRNRDVNPNQTVFVSWNPESAVVTRWRIFGAYWTDFCYPASDDLVVWPPSEQWILAYHHFEEFTFGQRRE